jgi:hypothetical protein
LTDAAEHKTKSKKALLKWYRKGFDDVQLPLASFITKLE